MMLRWIEIDILKGERKYRCVEKEGKRRMEVLEKCTDIYKIDGTNTGREIQKDKGPRDREGN